MAEREPSTWRDIEMSYIHLLDDRFPAGVDVNLVERLSVVRCQTDRPLYEIHYGQYRGTVDVSMFATTHDLKKELQEIIERNMAAQRDTKQGDGDGVAFQ